ncbi:UDP-N-acetylmuramoyl-L-alanine--D-glutamate ligase [Actinospica sp. MGRD01-02]|uniref:UDP-N-acetylmuramoylalanine--D-glutamate ligase n=1 Tax=Actinospica acidithermotolerans TaxID=2828514 RepID=A0A941IHJ3_9ACTN|nr:UDP-N-acetylmuramoyl-L-alanine--D-glutamate ligase [Actinospica acidithermotolerans]MBR7828600.1 UDP-N-acetylmuramoyl-L-alanine--D-glutamate ligase [Actinospica acidithermotolerans]
MSDQSVDAIDWRQPDPYGVASVPWEGLRVCVVGARVVGISAAYALLDLGADVLLCDRYDDAETAERSAPVAERGATLRLGDDKTLPEGCDLLVVVPGIPPSAPIVAAAREAGIPVWGDAELAWRLRKPLPDGSFAPWLGLTGTNGKTTAVRMLAAMLEAGGKRAVACGNVGFPLVDAVLAEEPYEVLAIELSSYQLHWSESLSLHAAAVLNVAPDHLDWHGSMEQYIAAKAKIYERCRVACVYNVADKITERMVEEADVVEGCRAIGFTLGAPGLSMLGVVDGILADRAFIEDRRTSAAELGTIYDVEPHAPHNIANALAAGALARAYGAPVEAVRDGLRNFRPDPHRIEFVAVLDGVDYVDDSKATNTHAAAASLASYEHIVWIAGGLAKGAEFDDLVEKSAKRLRGVVLLGQDRAVIAEALREKAPDVPIRDIGGADTGLDGPAAIDLILDAAADLAHKGDTVLLAPACASMDMFVSYNQRGDLFAAAVKARKAAQG